MGKIMLNNIEYSGGSVSENITSEPTIITQAEYEALGDILNSDNVVYYIEDGASDEVTLVTELNDTATDTEIPTAKAVYDKVSEVNESLDKRNLLTYTNLNQLELTSANTVTDLFNALPIGSCANIHVDNDSDSTAFQASLPVIYAGELYVIKESSHRGKAEFTRNVTGQVWVTGIYDYVVQGWVEQATQVQIDTINSNLSDCMIVQTYVSDEYTLSADSSTSLYIDYEVPSGYKALTPLFVSTGSSLIKVGT